MTDRLIDVWVTTGLVHAGTYEAGSKISPIVPSCSIEPGQARRGWRAVEAEQILTGRNATDDAFRDAAQIALTGAVAREHNHFKIELAKRTIVRAFATARDANV